MEQKLEKILLNVAQAVLDNCMEAASRGRALDTMNLDEVISSVMGKEAKGVLVEEDLVDSLVSLVSEIDVHGNIEAEVEQAGIDAPYNRSQALLHKAGYEWPGKDVVRCEKYLAELTEQSLGQALHMAAGREVSMADSAGNKSYSGPVLGVTDEKLHVVQGLGPKAVIHETAKLTEVPEQGKMMKVQYDQGRGVVKDAGREQGKGVER